MDIIIGLTLGVVIGFALGVVVAAIAGILRKAKSASGAQSLSAARSGASTRIVARPESKTEAVPLSESAASAARSSRSHGDAGVMEMLAAREAQLGKSVFDVREAIRNLGEIITRTNAASSEAAAAFDTAQSNLEDIDVDDGASLASFHSILLEEVARVRSTNQTLRGELADAKKGIEEQRLQIEELKNAVRIDTLTKLPNRAAFDERIREFCQQLDRAEGDLLSLLMLDVDHFKAVNDTYGHLNGDRVLKGVALRIRESVRGNDLPARLGGEEFAVILPDTALPEAKAVAERIRGDLAKTVFKLDESNVHVTISGGLAQAWKGMRSPEEIIARADKALYDAKAAGRNRIVVFEPEEGKLR